MSSLRIKVQLGDDNIDIFRRRNIPFRKFIYFIDSPSHKTIDDLIRLLQEYISKKYSYTKTQIVDLMTNDGYVLSKLDLCSNVLQNNDHIICIDMDKFIDEYYSTHEDKIIWLELKQHDVSDDRLKLIRIGPNHFSQLFIRMIGTVNVSGLYIFGIHDLITIANEKRKDNLIARLDNTNDYNQSSIDWFLETKWEYDNVSNKDLFIICNLKIGSNDAIYSNKLHIIIDHSRMCIEKGEITHLSGEVDGETTLTDHQHQRLKELASKIPPPKRTGPQIGTYINPNLKITKHECEGESSIRMSYGNTNTVTTYQDFQIDDGTFCQHFVITHIIFSKKSTVLPEILNQKRTTPVDKPVSLVSLTVFYQIDDGSWRECQEVAISPAAMRDEERKWLTDSIINIEPDKLISFSIKGWISIKGEPGIKDVIKERIHKSLPQPLKLKIVVTDNLSKQSSLIVEQLNKPLELMTSEIFQKNHQSSIKEFLAFIYADNLENDERIYMGMYINTDNKLVFVKYNTSYPTLDRKAIRKMEFNAKQNKTTEVPEKNAQYEYYSQKHNAIALFDPETYMFYAVRLEVSTKTSKTEETVLIPIEKIK